MNAHRTCRIRSMSFSRLGIIAIALLGVLSVFSADALAQFSVPATTDIRHRVVGRVVSKGDDPMPQGGDQIAAFFNNKVVGLYVFQGVNPSPEFSIVVYGDNPETEEVEGPQFGQQVTFRYFQSSTSNTINMTPVNTEGRDSTYIYQGEALMDFPVILPGFDLTPVRELNLRFGGPAGGSGGTGGDGVDYDVNGDGKVDKRDVSAVLSLVIGHANPDTLARADVDGDGAITSRDAIAIMKAIRR